MATRYRPPKPAQANYITPEGAAKLQQELEHLWTVERPRVTQEVADAAAHGDRSENAEYIYGKKRLRGIDRRLRYLDKRLESITVVSPQPRDDGKIFFGAYVTIEDEDGNKQCFRIVGPDESNAKSGAISMEAPLAKALFGRSIGDEVRVRRPKGETTFCILAVRYTEVCDSNE